MGANERIICIIYGDILDALRILSIKSTISQKIKISKLFFHRHIAHLLLDYGHFWGGGRVCISLTRINPNVLKCIQKWFSIKKKIMLNKIFIISSWELKQKYFGLFLVNNMQTQSPPPPEKWPNWIFSPTTCAMFWNVCKKQFYDFLTFFCLQFFSF